MQTKHIPNPMSLRRAALVVALLGALAGCSDQGGPAVGGNAGRDVMSGDSRSDIALGEPRHDALAPCATIQTASGPVQGQVSGSACSYLGIP
jgi:hypothetical protein